MQPCQEHWDKLRAAIEARGIGHLVSSDGQKVMEKYQEFQAIGTETLDNYDPLIAAFMGTIKRLLGKPGGLAILENNPDGSERCMYCYVNEGCKCVDAPKCGEKWIDFAADGVAQEVERMRNEEFPTEEATEEG